jgi:hypothetical protein
VDDPKVRQPDIRKAKEDRSRLTGAEGSSLVYKLSGDVQSFVCDAFLAKQGAGIKVFVSGDPDEYAEVEPERKVSVFGKNDYGFFDAVRYSAKNLPSGTQFVKIVLGEGVQISRCEIVYGE